MIYTIIRADSTTLSLDCVNQFSESHSATVTQHPVESGSSITDHVFLNNSELSISGVVSDFSPSPDYITMEFLELIDAGANSHSHTQQIKATLLTIHKGRELLTIQVSDSSLSEVEQFENCVITSLSFNDDPESGEAIYPVLKISQIRVVSKQSRQEAIVPDELVPNNQKTTNADGSPATGTVVGSDGKPVVKNKAKRDSPEHNGIIEANYKSRWQSYRTNGFPIPLAQATAAADMGATVASDGTLVRVGSRITGDDAFDTSTILRSQAAVVSKSVTGTTQTAAFNYAQWKKQQGIESTARTVSPNDLSGRGVLKPTQ